MRVIIQSYLGDFFIALICKRLQEWRYRAIFKEVNLDIKGVTYGHDKY